MTMLTKIKVQHRGWLSTTMLTLIIESPGVSLAIDDNFDKESPGVSLAINNNANVGSPADAGHWSMRMTMTKQAKSHAGSRATMMSMTKVSPAMLAVDNDANNYEIPVDAGS